LTALLILFKLFFVVEVCPLPGFTLVEALLKPRDRLNDLLEGDLVDFDFDLGVRERGRGVAPDRLIEPINSVYIVL
jgi:hypothetical protein